MILLHNVNKLVSLNWIYELFNVTILLKLILEYCVYTTQWMILHFKNWLPTNCSYYNWVYTHTYTILSFVNYITNMKWMVSCFDIK